MICWLVKLNLPSSLFWYECFLFQYNQLFVSCCVFLVVVVIIIIDLMMRYQIITPHRSVFLQQSADDVSQFDSKFTSQTPVDSPDDSTLSESANQVFLVSVFLFGLNLCLRSKNIFSLHQHYTSVVTPTLNSYSYMQQMPFPKCTNSEHIYFCVYQPVTYKQKIICIG